MGPGIEHPPAERNRDALLPAARECYGSPASLLRDLQERLRKREMSSFTSGVARPMPDSPHPPRMVRTGPRVWTRPRRVRLLALVGLLGPPIKAAPPEAPEPSSPAVEPAQHPPPEDAPERSQNTPERSQEGDKDQEVTVRGQRPHPLAPARRPGVAGSTIRREALTSPGKLLAESLREAPGVQVTQSGGLGAPATANVRGATSAQTPVFFGPIRLNDEVGGVLNLADVPPALIERIEIFRSHAPPEVSTWGLGGAILMTPRAPAQRSRLRLVAGSFGTRGLDASVGLRRGEHGLALGASFDGATNDYPFRSAGGTLFIPDDDAITSLPNADATQLGAWMHGQLRWRTAQVNLFWQSADREQGAPKLALTPSRQARASYFKHLIAVSSRLPIDAWNGELALVTSAATGQTRLHDPAAELLLSAEDVRTPGTRLEQLAQARQLVSRRVILQEQLAVSRDTLHRVEDAAQTASATRTSVRLSVTSELQAGRHVDITVGGALRCFHTAPAEASLCSRLEPEGQIGIAFRKGGLELSATGGHYHRLPTLSELYGTSLIVRGNPNLAVERGQSAELVLRYQKERPRSLPLYWLELSPFARISEELIIFVRAAPGYLVPQNRGRARTLGAELTAGASPLPGLALSAQLSLLDPRDTSPDRQTNNDLLPFLSQATGHLKLDYDLPRFSDHLTLRASSVVSYQSGRFADPAGLGLIPGQVNWDVTLDVVLLRGADGGEVRIETRLANLLDSARFDLVGFPLPGRSFFSSLELSF